VKYQQFCESYTCENTVDTAPYNRIWRVEMMKQALAA